MARPKGFDNWYYETIEIGPGEVKAPTEDDTRDPHPRKESLASGAFNLKIGLADLSVVM